MCELKLSLNHILKQLKLLDINKASLGLPTKFTVPSPKLLQECAEEISPSLCRLFDMSLELGAFPEKWKDANLDPIYKKLILKVSSV